MQNKTCGLKSYGSQEEIDKIKNEDLVSLMTILITHKSQCATTGHPEMVSKKRKQSQS